MMKRWVLVAAMVMGLGGAAMGQTLPRAATRERVSRDAPEMVVRQAEFDASGWLNTGEGNAKKALAAVAAAEEILRKQKDPESVLPQVRQLADMRKALEAEIAVDEALAKDATNGPAQQKKAMLLLSRRQEVEAAGHLSKSGVATLEKVGTLLAAKRETAEQHLALAQAIDAWVQARGDVERDGLDGIMGQEVMNATMAKAPETRAQAQALLERVGPGLLYGTPGGGAGPKVAFFGLGGGGASRVVYVLDHSGSMLDSFDFLRQEVVRSVKKMIPVQRFAVVMYSETVDASFPKNGEWTAATGEGKRDVDNWVSSIKAQGQNDDLREPFVAALKKALAMDPKPQVVYFLTDGNFDAKVAEEVAKLNADKKVRIHTIGFVKIGREAEETLKKIARDNGGKYKFVSEKDLEAK